jgi:hypothetical protein
MFRLMKDRSHGQSKGQKSPYDLGLFHLRRISFQRGNYCIKPRSEDAKFAIFGNTEGSSAGGSPNQRARVAAYCSTEVVGIHLPRAPEPLFVSSGPLVPMTKVGNGVPFEVFIP